MLAGKCVQTNAVEDADSRMTQSCQPAVEEPHSPNTCLIRGSHGIPGGIGHALVDVHTALLLAQILELEFVYTDIVTIPIGRYEHNIRGIAEPRACPYLE